MKRLFILVFALLGFTSVFAQTPLQNAEEFYRQGKFSAALGLYEYDLKTHPNDPYVYYNIGNCYFKMGSMGLAAANYYRAFKLAPRNTDIRNNLALALSAGGESLVPAGVPPVLHKAFFSLSYSELKGLTMVLWWVFCLLACVWVLKRRGGRIAATVAVVLLLSAGWFYMRHKAETEPLAVVAAPVAEIRSGPGTNFPASASVAQGHLLTVQDEKDSWYEVIVKSQGIKGWVDKNAIEQI
ncbi:tetratricopeptide repeat protein [Candidatus Avelusimicrobium sp.]|uniref:tetratricopeptide repeat protein n=1 Tax=Candidatus Avelusimicrobium sp. TaxID=3048833 RepID=UPI003D7D06E4